MTFVINVKLCVFYWFFSLIIQDSFAQKVCFHFILVGITSLNSKLIWWIMNEFLHQWIEWWLKLVSLCHKLQTIFFAAPVPHLIKARKSQLLHSKFRADSFGSMKKVNFKTHFSSCSVTFFWMVFQKSSNEPRYHCLQQLIRISMDLWTKFINETKV